MNMSEIPEEEISQERQSERSGDERSDMYAAVALVLLATALAIFWLSGL